MFSFFQALPPFVHQSPADTILHFMEDFFIVEDCRIVLVTVALNYRTWHEGLEHIEWNQTPGDTREGIKPRFVEKSIGVA